MMDYLNQLQLLMNAKIKKKKNFEKNNEEEKMI